MFLDDSCEKEYGLPWAALESDQARRGDTEVGTWRSSVALIVETAMEGYQGGAGLTTVA